MLVDWFTFFAQVVNFLILIWLMKRFLYTPILDAIDAREQRIAAGLADALARQSKAQKEYEEYREKNEEFERQRKALLGTATLEAQAERQRLFEDARKAQEDLRRRQQEAMHNDFRNQKDEIVRHARDEIFAIARKTLADLAAESLEKQMVETFIRRCGTLGQEQKRGLQTAFGAAVGPGLIRSTFPLPKEQQRDLEQALRQTFAFAGQLQFETSPDLVSGIALSVNGYEVAWSIADYLPALERSVTDLLSVRPPGAEPVQANSDETDPTCHQSEFTFEDHADSHA